MLGTEDEVQDQRHFSGLGHCTGRWVRCPLPRGAERLRARTAAQVAPREARPADGAFRGGSQRAAGEPHEQWHRSRAPAVTPPVPAVTAAAPQAGAARGYAGPRSGTVLQRPGRYRLPRP